MTDDICQETDGKHGQEILLEQLESFGCLGATLVPRNVGSVAGWGCHHWVWDVTGICQGYRPQVPSGAATGEVREAAAEYSFDSSLDDEDSNGGCLTIGSLRGWKNVL